TRLFLLLGHRRLYTTSDAVGDKPLVHPRYLRRGRRPSSSGFGEAFASTGAEPECTKSSTLDGVHGGLRPSPLARERRRRSERTRVLEHRSAAPLPRGLGEAKTRDRRASWSVKIPAMPPLHRPHSRSPAVPRQSLFAFRGAFPASSERRFHVGLPRVNAFRGRRRAPFERRSPQRSPAPGSSERLRQVSDRGATGERQGSRRIGVVGRAQKHP